MTFGGADDEDAQTEAPGSWVRALLLRKDDAGAEEPSPAKPSAPAPPAPPAPRERSRSRRTRKVRGTADKLDMSLDELSRLDDEPKRETAASAGDGQGSAKLCHTRERMQDSDAHVIA
ncbi:unnamed protein product, partial [Polarella glacialis]